MALRIIVKHTGRHEAPWVVVHGARRCYYDSKHEAEGYGHILGRKHGGLLVIYKSDGTIKEQIDYDASGAAKSSGVAGAAK
jgi:hypothetical protein